MDIQKILAATRFAAHKHKDQRRKDHAASPYIVHPIAAAELLIESGIEDEATIISALLHDTIEDTETSIEEISEIFGPEIASIVSEVTVMESGDKAADKRKEIADAHKLSKKAALVRTADKICNMRDILVDTPRGWTEERRNRYFIWAQKVIAGANTQNSNLLTVLSHVISEAEQRYHVSLAIETDPQ